MKELMLKERVFKLIDNKAEDFMKFRGIDARILVKGIRLMSRIRQL